MKKNERTPGAKVTSRKPEKLLKNKSSKPVTVFSETESLKLIHQYKLRQIELESKNNELLLARSVALEAVEKFTELYDFTPAGYFTLSKDGKVIELNQYGSQMLGKERSEIKNSEFVFFVSNNTKPLFHLFLRKIFSSKSKETCEISLCIKDNLPMYVHLAGIKTENGEQCLVTVVDITGHNLMQDAELKKAQRYQTLAEVAPVGIFHTDATGYTTYVNPSWRQITGLSDEEALGNNWLKAVHEEDKKVIIRGWEDAVKTQETSFSEYRFIRPDGSIAWVMGQAIPEKNTDKKVLGYVGTITDITSRKRIEERQKESERFLKETQLIAKLGTYSFDIITGRWRSSEVLDNIFGIEGDYNKNFENWQAIVHPDWRKKMTDYFIDEVIGSKSKFDYEYKIIRINDQAERWVHGIGNLKLNDDNQPISMVGTIRDITEHKEIEIELTIAKELAEERNFKIKNYLENAPDGVFVADEKGNYIEVNPAATLITGYTKEELLKMSVKDLTAPASLKAAYNHFHILVQTGSSKGDIQYVHKNGDTRWSSVEAVKLSERKFLGFVKDITERKKNEEEIKISNERFELIAKATNDGLWDWDLEADLLWANEIHQQFYGLTLADPVPKSKDWIQRIHPEDRERTVEAFEKAKASDTKSHVDEYRFYTENKDWMNVYGRTLIERNIEGKPIRLIGSMMDITERKKTEAAIKASEEKYRQLFENSPMPMWVYEIDSFQILDVNEAAISHYGYTKAEFTGLKVFDLRPTEEVVKFLSTNRDLKQGLRNFGVWKHKKKDGTLIDVEVNSHDIDFNQRSSRLVLAYDVTEKMKMQWALAESENRLRTIYNTEPECIKLLGPKGEIIEMNPAGLQIIEADSLMQVKEKSILSIINEPYRKVFQKLIKNIFKGNSGKLEFEITGLKGAIRWLDTHAIPLKDNEGKIISFLGVARDITENKKAQEEIKNTAEQLRQLTAHIQIIREEERKRIGREIHDELGQQLTAIKMDVVWIDKKIPEETSAVKNKLKNIIALLDGSNQSIRRILSELRPVILDDRGLLESMEWMGNQFTANTGIPVKFTSSETEIKLSEPVATCIFRVYQEAFTNITRHAMAKKVFSSINIIDDAIKVTIKDDGKGFNAVSVQNKTKFGILGMKERVLSLNGKFDLVSQPETGTEITIKLPYATLKNRLLSKK